MRTGLYSNHILKIIEEIPAGELFTNEKIAELLKKKFDLTTSNAELITNNKLKRLFDDGKIERVGKGVYYVPKQTVFGLMKPDYNKYAVNLLTKDDDKIIGYESGASFLNKIGLSTLIPREIEVVSNNYRKKLPEACHITAKKPSVLVNNENFRYLQMLDVISGLNTLHIDAENPTRILKSVIFRNGLDPVKLAGYARKYYPQRILPSVIDVIIEDDFA